MVLLTIALATTIVVTVDSPGVNLAGKLPQTPAAESK